jgi:acyl-ACP thioesterase
VSLLPFPGRGRVYTGERQVRLGDAAPDRRLRLDAVARYLQDVAEDDAADADLPASVGWVLRRTRLVVARFPVLGETVRLATFCSAAASRWAERTTTLTGERGGLLQAVSVWVAIDIATGAPTRLGDRFHEVYGPSAEERKASARLTLAPPPDEVRQDARPWPLRATDLDVWRHVNNAVSWAAVEDGLDAGRWRPLCAELEHREPIEAGVRPTLVTRTSDGSMELWLLDGNRVLTAARLSPGD